MLDWLLIIFFNRFILIPGEVILYLFGWAQESSDVGGLKANSQWFYCILAVSIFIFAWELILIVARRYIIWIKR